MAAAGVACAGLRSSPHGRSQQQRPTIVPTPTDAAIDAAAARPGEEVPTLDALALRGASEMPLMREVLRSADATNPSVLELRSEDTCLRAVVAASAPVRARFEDDGHAVRGAELAGTNGLVPPKGPACARKGETLRLVVESEGAAITARAVIWQAP